MSVVPDCTSGSLYALSCNLEPATICYAEELQKTTTTVDIMILFHMVTPQAAFQVHGAMAPLMNLCTMNSLTVLESGCRKDLLVCIVYHVYMCVFA